MPIYCSKQTLHYCVEKHIALWGIESSLDVLLLVAWKKSTLLATLQIFSFQSQPNSFASKTKKKSSRKINTQQLSTKWPTLFCIFMTQTVASGNHLIPLMIGPALGMPMTPVALVVLHSFVQCFLSISELFLHNYRVESVGWNIFFSFLAKCV